MFPGKESRLLSEILEESTKLTSAKSTKNMEKLENLHINDDSEVEKTMNTLVNSNFPYDKIGKDIC